MKTALHRFFRSVAGKVFVILTLCAFSLLILNWIFNAFAFFTLYQEQKESQLTGAYHDICTAIEQRENLKEVVETYQIQYGLSITIWDNHQLLYSSEQPIGSFQPFRPSEPITKNAYRITQADDRMQLYGKTRSGIQLLLQVTTTDAQKNSVIINRFFLWSTMATFSVALIVIFVLSRVFSRPVRRLSTMAQHMANQEFADRYTETGEDELSVLGNSLNAVSDTMEESLAELKTAHARLQTDREITAVQNEARDRFIRNVSHELKTPISLIQTYAEGLHENIAANAEDREYYCTVIEDEAQKLSQIITKLTLLMQLESGKEELVIEHFDLTALLNRLLQRHSPLFADRGVPLPRIADTPCFVWGDALLIENVITNYLTNALHHVSDGGVIEIRCEPTNENTMRVTVFNTGDPIPDGDLPHIFESFYKVDKARTRAYGGTGIGLSVVAAIMQAHHMPYGVRNLPNGVEFRFDLQV